ncbi:MAG: TIGR03960 family B12-binding radical SAM protein [Deltaproteobacteria bacterium]|nr:TIGR03960 family B12-binding radical SAM protein [Deltaproteobacteria bacterium]
MPFEVRPSRPAPPPAGAPARTGPGPGRDAAYARDGRDAPDGLPDTGEIDPLDADDTDPIFNPLSLRDPESLGDPETLRGLACLAGLGGSGNPRRGAGAGRPDGPGDPDARGGSAGKAPAGRPSPAGPDAAPFPFGAALLATVQRPGRYLGGETGAAPNEIPDGKGRMFRVALAFPDVYEIAHSHLGHKILYGLINSEPGLSAERAYAPWTDMEGLMRERGVPLASLESRRPLREFGLVGFSLQYELGYTNILNMLDMAGIPLLASERGVGDPIVAAGGPGCANPEPLCDFVDLFFLGDGEPNLVGDLKALREMLSDGMPRREILRALALRPGIYVPSMFAPEYGPGPSGPFMGIAPLSPGLPMPRRTAAAALGGLYFPTCQIVPSVKPVHDRVAVEIARGCSRGCRFCQAGYIYRPVRERSASDALELVRANLVSTGHDEAAFLSLSAGDHTMIAPMVRGFMDRWSGTGVSLSLPSMRVRSVTRDLALQIRRARKTGFTIAPEAATGRLRAVINKDLSEEDLLRAAETAFSLGWKTLKLYFMCGLPTETDLDLEAVGVLARKIGRSTRARLNVGLAHFTPKAHTPFQWEPGSLPETVAARIGKVKSAARRDGIAVKHADPGASFAESLVARGDRRMGRVIRRVWESGARFEAWNDLFRIGPWEDALAREGFDARAFTAARDPGAPLPWDHIFYGVDKPFLLRERERAFQGLATPDCRDAGCQGCGACGDGAGIALASERPAEGPEEMPAEGPEEMPGKGPEEMPGKGPEEMPGKGPEEMPGKGPEEMPGKGPRNGPDGKGSGAEDGRAAGAPSKGRGRRGPDPPAPPEFRYLARFEKTGRPVFLGHLELVELFKRAFRRGGLELSLTRGFHPSPKLSFMTALPLGVPSLDEVALFSLAANREPSEILSSLDLPEGVRLTALVRHPLARPRPELKGSIWLVSAGDPVFRDPPLYPEAQLGYTDKKGRDRAYRVGDFVSEARALSPESLLLTVAFRETGSPKPALCARALWGLDPSLPLELSKLKTLVT